MQKIEIIDSSITKELQDEFSHAILANILTNNNGSIEGDFRALFNNSGCNLRAFLRNSLHWEHIGQIDAVANKLPSFSDRHKQYVQRLIDVDTSEFNCFYVIVRLSPMQYLYVVIIGHINNEMATCVRNQERIRSGMDEMVSMMSYNANKTKEATDALEVKYDAICSNISNEQNKKFDVIQTWINDKLDETSDFTKSTFEKLDERMTQQSRSLDAKIAELGKIMEALRQDMNKKIEAVVVNTDAKLNAIERNMAKLEAATTSMADEIKTKIDANATAVEAELENVSARAASALHECGDMLVSRMDDKMDAMSKVMDANDVAITERVMKIEAILASDVGDLKEVLNREIVELKKNSTEMLKNFQTKLTTLYAEVRADIDSKVVSIGKTLDEQVHNLMTTLEPMKEACFRGDNETVRY